MLAASASPASVLGVIGALVAACAPPTEVGLDAPPLDVLGRGLPAGFLLGAASSSHQIEGGNDNDWTEWEASVDGLGRPRIRGGQRSGLAADDWRRFGEDLEALRMLGANSYRFSVEWSRLEPVEGAWNADAMAQYRAQVLALRAAGIEPMVTIHHFTLPKWIAARGGFEHPDTAEALARFAGTLAVQLGDGVDLWCPFNELTVYATLGYLMGLWPPGVTGDVRRQVRVMAAMLEAHAKMAAALRRHDTVDADGDGRATVVTTAHHVRIFEAASPSPFDALVTQVVDDVANEAVPRAFKTGRFRVLVPGVVDVDAWIPGLAGSIDVLGVNYYSRDFIRADLGSSVLAQASPHPRAPRSDVGWELYPDGLTQVLVRMARWGLPLIVTENGVADASGAVRPRFLAAHMAAVERAVAQGVDVRGYYHWSLTDNFEWAEGTDARFGLFRVDFDTFARTPTDAVPVFQAIRRNLEP